MLWAVAIAIVLIASCGAAADYDAQRERMVKEQIASRDVTDMRVLAAMRKVPRHEFVPEKVRSSAYADSPLPICHGQTISQPYIVALMTELVQIKPGGNATKIGRAHV